MNQPIVLQNSGSRKASYMKIVSKQAQDNFKLPLLLILLHIPLGIFLYNAGPLGLLHPLAVLVIGMRRALLRTEKLESVAQIATYIVGVEVLWRMASIPVFWEIGKYGSALIMITALLRRRLWKIPVFPVFYFALLMPAILLTYLQYNLNETRSIISSTLSGPFLLLISCWFFSNLKLTRPQIRNLLLVLIIPLLSVAVTTLFYTVTTPDIEFGGESNFATSGGFGPNQVSSMLGLGAFLCVASFLLFKNNFYYVLFFGVLTILFMSQSVLTFSRGGMYNAVAAILLIIVFQVRNLKDGIRRLLPVAGIVIIFLLVVFPYLDDFTGGALQDRFEDSSTSKRGDIVETDIKIFLENPVLGVGVGKAYTERAKYLEYKAMSHTEFGRVVAEHGFFGLLSLIALMMIIIYNFRKQDSIFGKALVAGLVGWSMFFMLNAGMRLAAPSLILGMIYLTVINIPFRTSGQLNAE